ncbi:MAG: hypothetical protein BME93_04790 [Methanosarcinales archaeon Met12]|nr:MAG: hypothetical protein BME93_04790 [Methanosarcinales archaeon Met12]
MKVEIEEIQGLKTKVESLEAEVLVMRRTLGVKTEKKDEKAWKELEKLGKSISKGWTSKKPSWKLISESRR